MIFMQFEVICPDDACPQFEKIKTVSGRIQIFQHARKKSTKRIIEILNQFDLINDFSYFTRLTLVNMFTDCCYARTATKLLEKLRQKNEMRMKE